MILSDNIATLIHDIKTPVIAQERILDMLLNNAFGELNEAQAQIISQVKDSCKYLHNIVYSAMNLYKEHQQGIKLNVETFSMGQLLKEVCIELEGLARLNNQTFKIDLQKCEVKGDVFQIKRVLINIISNAIKYSKKDSSIEIYVKNTEGKLLFMVKNHSRQAVDTAKIFNKFESTTNSGLGLYLVNQVIEAHGGCVFAKSEGENKYCIGFVIPNI